MRVNRLDPESERDEEGIPAEDHIGRTDSEDDVYEDRLMDARPTGITVPPEDEDEQESEGNQKREQ